MNWPPSQWRKMRRAFRQCRRVFSSSARNRLCFRLYPSPTQALPRTHPSHAMAKVLGGRVRLVTYVAGVRALACRVAAGRTFSTSGVAGGGESDVTVASPQDGDIQTVWPDERMGPFGPRDSRFQLPGNIGFSSQVHGAVSPASARNLAAGAQPTARRQQLPDVLVEPSAQDRHTFVLAQFVNEFQGMESSPVPPIPQSADTYFDSGPVECVVQGCPELLQRDFATMFPEAPNSDLTVITVTQKTQNNMTAWSPDVEEERDRLMQNFVEGAKEICFALRAEGYWADFVDPSSGMPFFGPYTNSPLFETDGRYRQLGFQVEDLGCCKVIRHRTWGSHVLVGSLLTDAPTSSSLLGGLTHSGGAGAGAIEPRPTSGTEGDAEGPAGEESGRCRVAASAEVKDA
ncbi:unnamed protein product [Lampetra planeri]